MPHAYQEIIDFIAAGTSARHLVAFQPSPASKARVAELWQREKTSGLALDERDELDHYLQFEHLMRVVKARARRTGP